jgi:hypothetical protein
MWGRTHSSVHAAQVRRAAAAGGRCQAPSPLNPSPKGRYAKARTQVRGMPRKQEPTPEGDGTTSAIYAVLHHPEYRERCAAHRHRERPRIPFAGSSGAKAQMSTDADAALKRCSSTVLHASCSSFTKSEINVNGVGQECPTHTGGPGSRKIPTGLFFLMFR